MEIDLTRILKLNLNINEYLTLLKLEGNNHGIDFPFTSTIDYIKSLEEKGFVTILNGQVVEFTEKGRKAIHPREDVNFDELFDMYPSRTPGGRTLKAKSKKIGGRLTKDYKFLRDKYLTKIKTKDMHNKVIAATEKMLKDSERRGSIEFVRKLEYYINKQEWEQYIDEDGAIDNEVEQDNWERI